MRYKKHKQYRLKDFDYSGGEEYFITICVANRKKYFGKIIDENIDLFSVGKIVDKTWNEMPNKCKNISLNAYQIMPDHFHGIIIINNKPQINCFEIWMY